MNIKKVLLVPNKRKPESIEYANKCVSFFSSHSIQTELLDVDKPDNADESFDMAVVFGGDGSVLRAVSVIGGYNIPIVGINFGHFGYLTECDPENAENTLTEILSGNCYLESRMMIDCKIIQSGRRIGIISALNEAVIHRGNGLNTLSLSLLINGKDITSLSADGIIISTPTGSTAYNLSAGGPLLIPTSENIAITPICQRNSICNSIVASGNDVITVKPHEECLLALDGDKSYVIDQNTVIELTRSQNKVDIIKVKSDSFFTTLKNKLSENKA